MARTKQGELAKRNVVDRPNRLAHLIDVLQRDDTTHEDMFNPFNLVAGVCFIFCAWIQWAWVPCIVLILLQVCCLMWSVIFDGRSSRRELDKSKRTEVAVC